MSKAYSVLKLGSDSSGRQIKTTTRTAAKLAEAERRLGRKVTIVKGGGLPADSVSGETHMGLGTLDVRTWNIGSWSNPTGRKAIEQVVRDLRLVGFAAWYRDQQHGRMDPHIHMVDIGNHTNSPAARRQVADYKRGLDGLASRGKDYHPRVKIRPWGLVRRIVAVRLAQRDLDKWRADHQD